MTPYLTQTRIDELTRPDHSRLVPRDMCWFFGDYEPKGGFESPTNSLIWNFKKSPERQGLPEWHYKLKAIDVIAQSIAACVRQPDKFLFVPVPPSKHRDDPGYDTRLVDVFERPVLRDRGFRMADVISRSASVEPSHLTDEPRPLPAVLAAELTIDAEALDATIGGRRPVVFDDVITTGTQFKAVQMVLAKALGPDIPTHEILGLFVARRVPKGADVENFEF